MAAPTDDFIINSYVTPGNPIAFSTPDRVAKFFAISKQRAKRILEKVDGYTLHREYKQPRIYNPYYVHERREEMQADLIDVSQIAEQNDGVRFLLVIIDIFTKFTWAIPIKTKSAKDMKDAFNRWLNDLDVAPSKVMSDNGVEFKNRLVRQIFHDKNIEWISAHGTLKACIAERVNKTIQILMHKYMTENETLRYIDVLPQLMETYNNRGHRTLKGMTPADADKVENEDEVHGIHMERYRERREKAEKRQGNRPLPFKVDDVVRIKTQPKKISSSSRAYAEQFHGEYFRIIRINQEQAVPLYYLRSLDDGELIEGGFYANELQKQSYDVFKVERILAQRVRRGQRQVLVRWKYFSPRHDSWEPYANIVRIFRRDNVTAPARR